MPAVIVIENNVTDLILPLPATSATQVPTRNSVATAGANVKIVRLWETRVPSGQNLVPHVFRCTAFLYRSCSVLEVVSIKLYTMAEADTQHSLRSLLCTEERDFLIRNNGDQVPVSELIGKTVGLYISAHWCPPCRAFTPKLAQVYNKLKENGEAFEIVFLSSDRHQEAFEEYHASMPWLALPFGDKVKKDLSRYFSIQGIPSLVIIGPDGKTVTTDARNIVSAYGAKAYPFTDARLIELQKEVEAAAEKYPKEIKHELHEHSLNLIQRKSYICDGCQERGSAWSFYCEECDFNLHPDCALKDNHSDENEEQVTQGKGFENGDKPAEVICEGDVCRRV